MDSAAVHRELESLAEQLGIEVRVDDLEGSRGGLCRLGGRRFLLIDGRLPLADRVRLMLDAIAVLPLDAVFVLPHVRELLKTRAVDLLKRDAFSKTVIGRNALGNTSSHSQTNVRCYTRSRVPNGMQ